jgi:peptide deformylase
MAVKRNLQLSDPKFYKISQLINKDKLIEVKAIIQDIYYSSINFIQKPDAGRAIAATQIGYIKSLIYINTETY